MKIQSVRISFLALILGALSIGSAMAQSSVSIRVGSQGPPPNRYEKQWQQPYKTAQWIPGHNEWRRGRYYWVPGYYSYPPRRNERWVQPRYQRAPDGYSYRPGYWGN